MCRGTLPIKLMVVAVRRKLFLFVSITDIAHTVNKLLMRALPNNFPEDSVYTWFPMTTPAEMEKALAANPEGWSFTRPAIPAAE